MQNILSILLLLFYVNSTSAAGDTPPLDGEASCCRYNVTAPVMVPATSISELLVLFMPLQTVDHVLSYSIANVYNDGTGTYDVDGIKAWGQVNQEQIVNIEVKNFLKYLSLDTWGEPAEPVLSNLHHLLENEQTLARVMKADLTFPIIVTNYHKIVDGVHRIFKAVKLGNNHIKAIFINQSTLDRFLISSERYLTLENLPVTPIPARYLVIHKNRLSEDQVARRDELESYFCDHLPSANPIGDDKWGVLLERPSTPYGNCAYDNSLSVGLAWWGKRTRVRDIAIERCLFKGGLLAIEDQWIPLSWSYYFQRVGELPQEVTLLHIDDHQDMMSPRLGVRLDGALVDYITGEQVSLLDPVSVEAAINSGAIGKGSIVTPLIWSIAKVHVRHLTFRPYPHRTHYLNKLLCKDSIITGLDNKISVHTEPTSWGLLHSRSNYVATNDLKEWLQAIPAVGPILLHIDMDYFNNRFDGDSDWASLYGRHHDTSLETQTKLVDDIFIALRSNQIIERIADVSIGISAGFYPAEFWSMVVPMLLRKCGEAGLITPCPYHSGHSG